VTDFRDDMAGCVPLWSLTEDALVELGEDGSLVVMTRWGEFDFGVVDALTAESLRRMALGPVRLGNVIPPGPDSHRFAEPGTEPGGPSRGEPSAALGPVLARLRGSVVRSLGLDDGKGPMLSVLPVGIADEFVPVMVPPRRRVRLSRFAALRPGEGGLLLESPVSSFQVLLSRPHAIRIASALAVPVTVADVAAEAELALPVAEEVLGYLAGTGTVLVADPSGRFAEDSDRDLRRWFPHELPFHVRSRTRLGDEPSEAEVIRTLRSPPPVAKPVPHGPVVPLHRPDLAVTVPGEKTLTSLLEMDHDCPAFSDRALRAAQIGELLYRGARIRSVGTTGLPGGVTHLASQRPYFNIACLYELELYLSVHRCTGLARGIYHYEPGEHVLTHVNDNADDLAAILDMAMVAGAGHHRPGALLTVTARMERSSWALGGASYAAALLHLGALQQTLYLAGKLVGLAVHAVPVDVGDRVDGILRLPWPAEVSIGECVLDVLP
jgi:SagB-type dehydrogenase family enzyme